MRAITQYLKGRGFGVVDDNFYTYIEQWERWYRGKVPAFHMYWQYNGKERIRRTRRTLGMAKKIPEDWANLELNEKAEIILGKKSADKRVHKVLERNNFRVRANQLLEISYAMGTGAFVEYLDGGDVKIDYIRAGMIYPLTWNNGEITECAFASERTIQKARQVYLNIHRLEQGQYVVENHLFERQGSSLREIGLPEGVQPQVHTGSDLPLFQIVKPNICNNIDPDCPMGVSVYANAIDQLEGLDLVYDSYCNEFALGKKRIIVPLTMAQIAMEQDGAKTPVFDANDTEFYAVPGGGDHGAKIEEINMELRHEAHEAGIKTALNLLASKCGLGNDCYNFEHGGLKTATEVVSEKSELFQNLRKHELLLERALADMARAVAALLGLSTDFEVTVSFDDSIITDAQADKQQFLQEIRDGVRQKWEYRVKFFGETEEEAKRMAEPEAGDNETMGFGGVGC